jgi:ubiquinone/menaquinone biosynthesis C-methylase UbiE
VSELRAHLHHQHCPMNETDRIARAYEDLAARAGSRWDRDNPGNRAILDERRRWTRSLLDRSGLMPLAGKKVLEVGSGRGGELAWLRELGAAPGDLAGVDLLPDRVEAARRNFPEIRFDAGNAEHLEFPDESFDLLLALTVFSSILDAEMSRNVASEMTRVLRLGGSVLWYDVRYNSVSNRNVKAVPVSRIRQLFPALKIELHGVTLLPPLARRLGPVTGAYPVLARIPPLRSHLIGLLRKPGRV